MATAAAVVLVLSVQQANRSADAGRHELPSLSERSEQEPGRPDWRVHADKVYIGEPPEADPAHPIEPGASGRVVVNSGGLQMEDVWVADAFGRSISIRSAQGCTMYALPPDFEAEDLYFSDPNGRWHRPYGEPVQQVPLHAHPAPETDSADPAWSARIADCRG